MSKTKKTTTPTARAGYRLEEDLLGTMEVPNDAYYGIHTLRAIDNFTISRTTINHVPEFIRGMVQVKKATALANRRLHSLPKNAKPLSGPATKSWTKDVAWINSPLTSSKAEPAPAST